MKVLFYGSKGWIGGMILEQWKNDPNVTITCSDTRLNFINTEKIRQEIKRHDRVFMAIGRTYGKGPDGNLINKYEIASNKLFFTKKTYR
jgi:hypothetical protein